MKKKNKGKVKKCTICLHQYKPQNLDKHMHGHAHHEAIERLQGGEQMHKCWACDVSLKGLKKFSEHIETTEHVSKLISLKERKASGLKVDYRNDELDALCAERDQNRSHCKLQKNKDKLKKWRGKNTVKFQEQLNQNSELNITAEGKSLTYSPNNENKQEVVNREPALKSTSDEEAHTQGWNSFFWQTSNSFMWSKKEDVDFTSDQVAQSGAVSFCGEEKAQQSKCTPKKQDGKRSCGADVSASPTEKRKCLRDVPSIKPRSTGEEMESKCRAHHTSASAPLRAPRLDHGHMDRLSVMLKNIRKSVDEQHSSEEPRPAKNDELRQNDSNKETALSDSPPGQTSITSQTCQKQTCKTRRKSSLHPQEKPEPTQNHADLQETTEPIQNHADPQETAEPIQNRYILPSMLVSKLETNKPNLKVARGIRIAHKPSYAVESRVLKPALQKLISSKSSQWRVNWQEMYQEAMHRKLQREKGLPRFGIELVTPLPPDPQQLGADDVSEFQLDEGFHWASIECDAVSPSVNSSSKAVCRSAPSESCLTERHHCKKTTDNTDTSCPVEEKKRDVGANLGSSVTNRSSEFVPDRLENSKNDPNTSGNVIITPVDSLVCVKTEKSDDYCTEKMKDASHQNRIQFISVTQIKQEKLDCPSTDTLTKNPPKNRMDELLVLSVREDELCSSLEDVEGQLLRAQAALQTAFLDVQRLQMIKQQVTAEMSSLRSQRINILQRLKNSSLNQSSSADPQGSAVQTSRRSAGSSTSRQHQDGASVLCHVFTDSDD